MCSRMADLDTLLSSFRIGEFDAHHALGFLIVENNVGHFADLGTFVTDVLFDV